MPSANEEFIKLIEIGVMPATATSVVDGFDQDAAIMPADIERARTNWYFSDAIPEAMRRILDARQE